MYYYQLRNQLWHILSINGIITNTGNYYKSFYYHVLLQQVCFGTIFVNIYALYFYHNIIKFVGNLCHSIYIFLYIIVHNIEYTVVQLHYDGIYVHYTYLKFKNDITKILGICICICLYTVPISIVLIIHTVVFLYYVHYTNFKFEHNTTHFVGFCKYFCLYTVLIYIVCLIHTVEYLHYYGVYVLYTNLAFKHLYIVYKSYYLHYYGRYESYTILNFVIGNGRGFTSIVATINCSVRYTKLNICIFSKRSRPNILNIKSPGNIIRQNRSSYVPAAKLSCLALCVVWQDNFYLLYYILFQYSTIFNNFCVNFMLRQYISKLVLYEFCGTLARILYNSNLVPLSFKICPFIYKIYNILENFTRYTIYCTLMNNFLCKT